MQWQFIIRCPLVSAHSVLRGFQRAGKAEYSSSHSYTAGASVEVLARAASEDAAWLAFQRMSAWWLGEHANVAANEFAGTSGMDANTIEDEGVIKPPSGRVEIATHNKPLSAGEVRPGSVCSNSIVLCCSIVQNRSLKRHWSFINSACLQLTTHSKDSLLHIAIDWRTPV